ncbi:MAG: ABC transporter permease [Gemmatimonadaceae bacterium]|nr:ABC transporter permease [Gloeobacterales cyanobacterium ES-bin-141]
MIFSRWWDGLSTDLEFAIATLRKHWAESTAVLLTLALGIGATAVAFAIVRAVLLEPLPYNNAARLVAVASSLRGDEASMSYPDVLDYQAGGRQMSDSAAFLRYALTLEGNGKPERWRGLVVGSQFLNILGLRPAIGRDFNSQDDIPGNRALLISNGLWRSKFAADQRILGKTMRLEGQLYTIVGVLPPTFFFRRDPQFLASLGSWLPPRPNSALGSLDPLGRGNHLGLRLLARLKDGASPESLEAQLDSVARQLERLHPRTNEEMGAQVQPLEVYIFGKHAGPIVAVTMAVVCTLLLAMANVMCLQLGRASARTQEMAIRSAVGATRWRIVRQLLTESLLLSGLSGIFGVLLTWAALPIVLGFLPNEMPRLSTITLDPKTLVFAIILSTAVGLLTGLIPAVWARSDPGSLLKQGGRGATASSGQNRFRETLVVTQVALSLVLSAGAAVAIDSARKQQQVPLGFESEGRFSTVIDLPLKRYSDQPAQRRFADELLTRLRALPGVTLAAITNVIPLGGGESEDVFEVYGRPMKAKPIADMLTASPDYFKAMGITLIAGRYFSNQDIEGGPQVTIVDETLAKRYWPDRSALGQKLRQGSSEWLSVVGVVKGVRKKNLSGPQSPQIYRPFLQDTWPYFGVILKTSVPPETLVRAVELEVSKMDADLPLLMPRTLRSAVDEQLQQPRLVALIVGSLAALALLNSAIGLYGAMSYSVGRRTGEIGIRMALGATKQQVAGLVIGRAVALTTLGLLAGSALALILKGTVENLTGGSVNVTVVVVAGSVLTAVALVASILPAIRAARIEPMAALRQVAQ